MATSTSSPNFATDPLELELLESTTELIKPPLYTVIMFDDDVTTMNFVIEVLKLFFNMSESKAQSIMLQVHHQGHAICGVYGRDIAESKVLQINSFSRERNFPLTCKAQPCE